MVGWWGAGWSEPSAQKIQQVKALRLDGKERAAGEAGEDKGRVGQSQLWSGTATEGGEGHSQGSGLHSKCKEAPASHGVISSNFCL